MRYLTHSYKLLIPVLLAFFLNATPGQAQNLLAFTPNGLSGWPDTIPRGGDTITVGGWLKNYSQDSSFQDFLYIEGTVDTGTGPMSFSFDFSFLQPTFQLAPGDSGFMLMPFVFDTTGSTVAPQFHVGNNVVVVWPIGVGPGSFQAADSVELNVFIIDTLSSIGPEYPPGDVRIYPVPSNGPLYVNSYHPQYHVTEIVIYDALGQVMYWTDEPSGPIDTHEWLPGLYTIQTTLSNGNVSAYKILRQ